MKLQNEKLEIRGRLILWSWALGECASILKLVGRTQRELDSGRPLEKEYASSAAFQAWLKSQPDYEAGPIKSSQLFAFLEINPTDYPSFTDCGQIKKYAHMLSVVLFCQMLNPGNYHEGTVASNTKHFVKTHLDQILEKVFATQEEIEKFYTFKESCLGARDRMIGHADGAAFNMKHGAQVTSSRAITSAIDSIDFQYMESIIEPLRVAVLEHANHVTA